MESIATLLDKVTDEQHIHHSSVSKVIHVKLARVLTDLMDACNEICGAMVSSADGMAWEQRLKADLDQHRFAAMSSALLALSDNMVKEAHQGTTKNALIESDGGNIFVMHAGGKLLLTVLSNPNSNLGMSLAHAKKAAEEIETLDL